MSGYQDDVLTGEGTEEGGRLIQKPFTAETLLDAVADAVADEPDDNA
jgi:hypothetical protein